MNFAIPYIIYDSFIIWMALISIFAALFNMNFVMVRNCSIFASIKFYPAVCNYSYFRDVGGKFTFSRDIPQFLRNSPKTFERRSLNTESKRISKMKEKRETENVHELQVLKPKENFEGKRQEILEVVVTRWMVGVWNFVENWIINRQFYSSLIEILVLRTLVKLIKILY